MEKILIFIHSADIYSTLCNGRYHLLSPMCREPIMLRVILQGSYNFCHFTDGQQTTDTSRDFPQVTHPIPGTAGIHTLFPTPCY